MAQNFSVLLVHPAAFRLSPLHVVRRQMLYTLSMSLEEKPHKTVKDDALWHLLGVCKLSGMERDSLLLSIIYRSSLNYNLHDVI